MDCPHCKLILEVVKDSEETRFAMRARCKSWDCEVCGPINSRNLGRLLGEAMTAYMAENDLTDPKLRYGAKLVTLTCPGDEWRDSRTVQERWDEFRKALTSELEYLRRHWGVKEYFKVVETQKDGTPHAHLIILGNSIASKGFMRAINDSWECRGMGRAETRLIRSLRGACHYVVKYLTKPTSKSGPKGKRCWSMSHELRRRVKENKEITSQEFTVIAVYKALSDGSRGSLVWSINSYCDLNAALRVYGEERSIPLFKGREIRPGVQVYIWSDP